MSSITFLIPAFNEEKNIESTILNLINFIKKFKTINFEIIVINDGSTDKTQNILNILKRKFKFLKIINNQVNLGLGKSIAIGIKNSTQEFFMFLPADDDIPLSTVSSLIRNLGKADILITYFINDEIRGKLRYIISRLFNFIYLMTFNVYLKYINGPAIYPTKYLKKLSLKSNKFSILAEINIKLLKKGLSYKEFESYRKQGIDQSSSLGFLSLVETIKIFLFLIYDVRIKNRRQFCKLPKRVV